MKCLFSLVAIGLLAGPALAGPEIVPTKGVRYATYYPATGELAPSAGVTRIGNSVWAATQNTGYYIGSYAEGWTVLDWGDLAGPQDIGGFTFGYGTDVLLPDRLDAVIMFFAEENGWNSVDRVYLAGFVVSDLPTADPGGAWASWIITVDLDAQGYPFTIGGSDLDGDGLADFGYTYWFLNVPPTQGNYTGPILVSEPNAVPSPAPGIENGFDAFGDPNLLDYLATYWFA